MIEFDRYQLENGLRILLHQDPSSAIAHVNVLYDVGARDEDENKTGFAHLFEHLMFEGSKNIPSFDEPLQMAGGENNAFTNNDITNYYISVPPQNLETAFWLESDRMLELSFSEEKLNIQKNVVVEEFNQRYHNQPYGDVFLLLRPLAYKKHPYQWPTIGKNIDHIKNANLEDIKNFFYSHYAPNNAILTVAGNFDKEKTIKLIEKWFNDLPRRKIKIRNLPEEPEQTEKRFLQVKRNVPYDAIYKAYHMPGRLDANYYTSDVISDILSNGKSSRLYQNLIKNKKYFSDVNAYITGDIDKGLFVVEGKIMEGIAIEDAENHLIEELDRLKAVEVSAYELEKVKNKYESVFQFTKTSALHKAMDLSYHELLGEASRINHEVNHYRSVHEKKVKEFAKVLLSEDNCSTLYYQSK